MVVIVGMLYPSRPYTLDRQPCDIGVKTGGCGHVVCFDHVTIVQTGLSVQEGARGVELRQVMCAPYPRMFWGISFACQPYALQ